jgi:dienelactone hydrolase
MSASMGRSRWRWLRRGLIAALVLLPAAAAGSIAWVVLGHDTVNLPPRTGQLDERYYPGSTDRAPLLVLFGGAEGGNTWASRRWSHERDEFQAMGFALLALGYFGLPNTPAEVDRISLDAIHASIRRHASRPAGDADCVAVMGGSKGGELVLALASAYPDIDAVVAIVAGDAAFPGHTAAMTTSSWSLHGEPLPFVPMRWAAVPALLRRDLRRAFELMLEDEAAVERARFPVERIAGPIFLLSASRDEFWPSREMSDRVVARLRQHGYPHPVEHRVIEGAHDAVQQHGGLVREFLQRELLDPRHGRCQP